MTLLALLDASNSLAPSSPTLPTSVGVAIVCAYLLNFVKKLKQIPQVSFYTTKLNSIIRAVTSFASTIGVSIQWSSTSHTLTIGNLTLAVVAGGLFHWVAQYGAQHGFEALFQSMQMGSLRAQKENLDPHLTQQ